MPLTMHTQGSIRVTIDLSIQDDKQHLELESIRADHLAQTFEEEKSSLVKELDMSRQMNKELRMSHSSKGMIQLLLCFCQHQGKSIEYKRKSNSRASKGNFVLHLNPLV